MVTGPEVVCSVCAGRGIHAGCTQVAGIKPINYKQRSIKARTSYSTDNNLSTVSKKRSTAQQTLGTKVGDRHMYSEHSSTENVFGCYKRNVNIS